MVPSQSKVGLLSRLTDFAASGQVTGSIPTELGKLTRLEHFSSILSQGNGTLPTELGRLSELNVLYLMANELTGTIPTVQGLWSFLDLSGNRLTGALPTERGHLSKLSDLLLSSLLVTGTVPSEICQLQSSNGGVMKVFSIDCTRVTCACCDCGRQ